jgi:hypothetical protein
MIAHPASTTLLNKPEEFGPKSPFEFGRCLNPTHAFAKLKQRKVKEPRAFNSRLFVVGCRLQSARPCDPVEETRAATMKVYHAEVPFGNQISSSAHRFPELGPAPGVSR